MKTWRQNAAVAWKIKPMLPFKICSEVTSVCIQDCFRGLSESWEVSSRRLPTCNENGVAACKPYDDLVTLSTPRQQHSYFISFFILQHFSSHVGD